VEFAAVQPDIEKDKAGPACLDGGERRRAVGGFPGLVALVLQDTGGQHPDVGLVVDDQDVMCHGRASPLRRDGTCCPPLPQDLPTAATYPCRPSSRYRRRRTFGPRQSAA